MTAKMTAKIKILHYIIQPYFYRCHFPFEDSVDIQHVFLGPAAKMPKCFKGTNRRIIINSTPNRYSPEIIKKIANEKPNIILFSDYSTDQQIMKTLKEAGYQLWLINHGIWCPGFLARRTKVGEKNNVNLQYITRAFHTPPEKNYFLQLGYSDKIFTSVRGYIGLDLLEQTKKDFEVQTTVQQWRQKCKLEPNDLVILYITNKAGFHPNLVCNDSITYKEYCKVFDSLLNWMNNKKVVLLSKMKMTRSLEMRTSKLKGHKHKQVRIVPGQDLLYPYLLLADVVIVQGYSTSYMEALYLNKPVIICQIPKNHDFQNVDQYENLLKAYDVNSLNKLLDNLTSDQTMIEDPLYQRDRKKYLDVYLAQPAESLVNKIETDAKILYQ